MQTIRAIVLVHLTVLLAKATAGQAGEAPKKADPFKDFPTVGGLTVFYGLEEATARIPRLARKPHARTIAPDGSMQPETLIFRADPYGAEVWSLTCGLYTDIANIERRPAWNCNGSIVGFVGNRVFRKPGGGFYTGRWAGHNYLMLADGSLRKRLVVTGPKGETGLMFSEKFVNWDRRDPDAIYVIAVRARGRWGSWSRNVKPEEIWLARVRLDAALHGRLELLYKFPNTRRKLIQNISDDNRMCIQDVNASRAGELAAGEGAFYAVTAVDRQGNESKPAWAEVVRNRNEASK